MKRTAVVLAAGLGLAALSLWLTRGGTDPTVEARAAYQRGDYAGAVRAYQTAAAECADLGALAANQAAALYRLDHFSDADGRYRIAESGADKLRAARAAYDRGNCALRLAVPTDGKPNTAMLDQAAEQFRACLGHEPRVGETENVFADARHNLELTKLLRNPSPGESKTDETALEEKDKTDPQHAGNDTNASGPSKNAESPSEQSPAAGPDAPKPLATFASLMAKRNDEDYLCPDCKKELEQLAASRQNGEKSNNEKAGHQHTEKAANAPRSENEPKTDDASAAGSKPDPQSQDASHATEKKEQKSKEGEQKGKDSAKSAQAQNEQKQDDEWHDQPKQQQGKAPT